MVDNELFIMPLKSIDLNSLLDIETTRIPGWSDNLGVFHNTSSNDVIPIWNMRPITDTSRYYEFEIKCLGNTENESDQDRCPKPVVENTEHCFICDITVPSGFLQAHNAGAKHRTCTSIISHALQRATQHITHTSHATTNSDTAISFTQNKTYCDHCNTVVNIEDKNNHEVTGTHYKAVTYDRQLQDFLRMFSEKAVIETYNYNNDDTNGKIEDKEYLRNNTLNGEEKNNTLLNKEVVKEKIDSDVPYKAAAVEYNEEYIVLKTIKGELVRIPPDNYQGFSRSASGIQCRVCREMVVDVAAHKMAPHHIELVTASVADRHCIRALTNMLNHCILCNEIIGDPLSHIFNNKRHDSLIKQYVSHPSENEANVKNTDDYYCNYCNLTVEKASKKRHKNSLDHRLKMWNANTKMHHHLKATEVLCEILCKVCNIVLQNEQECLDDHLQTFDHESKYKAMLVSNKILKISDCIHFCQICNIRLVDKEELHHIAGAKHVAKLQKWQESVLLDSKKEHALLKLKEKESDIYYSDVTDESDEMNADNLTDMVFERTHLNYLMEFGNDGQIKCKVCDLKIDNNADVINRHIKTFSHKFNYDAILNYNKVTAIERSDEFKFYCEYCKVQMKEESEIDHISDYLHSCERDFIKQLQSLNDQISDDKVLNCNTKDLTYITDTKSTENADGNKNVHYCDICNIDLENVNNVKSHYESETHKNNLDKTFTKQPKKMHYLMEVKNRTVQCKVCKVKVPNNVQNIHDHISGKNHKTTYKFLLNVNKINKVTGSFNCEICKETIKETMEIDHINTDSHTKLRTNNLSIASSSKKLVVVAKRDLRGDDEIKSNGDKSNIVKDYYYDIKLT